MESSTASVPDIDYELTTVPYGSGCVTTTVESFPFKRRTLLHVLNKWIIYYFFCACCDNQSYYFYEGDNIDTCKECRAPVCRKCVNCIRTYQWSDSKKCRWCASLVSPLAKIDVSANTEYQMEISNAQEQFSHLGNWFREVFKIVPKFDFSKIIWRKHFEKQGWRFYGKAEWFFNVKLPNQCDVVMANMVFHHTFYNSTHFKYRDNRNKFAEFFKRFSSEQEPELFFESRQMLLMQTISIMMLERMGNPFFDGVLRRVNANFSEKLSIGLGVRLRRHK
jgi:hypothetical protein